MPPVLPVVTGAVVAGAVVGITVPALTLSAIAVTALNIAAVTVTPEPVVAAAEEIAELILADDNAVVAVSFPV